MDSTAAWGEEEEGGSMAPRDNLEPGRHWTAEDTAGTENMESTQVGRRDRQDTGGMEDNDVFPQ